MHPFAQSVVLFSGGDYTEKQVDDWLKGKSKDPILSKCYYLFQKGDNGSVKDILSEGPDNQKKAGVFSKIKEKIKK